MVDDAGFKTLRTRAEKQREELRRKDEERRERARRANEEKRKMDVRCVSPSFSFNLINQYIIAVGVGTLLQEQNLIDVPNQGQREFRTHRNSTLKTRRAKR